MPLRISSYVDKPPDLPAMTPLSRHAGDYAVGAPDILA